MRKLTRYAFNAASSMTTAALALVLGSAAGAAASQLEVLPYGGLTGETVTIIGSTGIDTPKAVIQVRHTHENANAFCVQYRSDRSQACIDAVLRDVRVLPTGEANCQTMEFSTAKGGRFVFVGRNASTDARVPFVITDKAKSQELQSFGDYWVAERTFATLCPARYAEYGGTVATADELAEDEPATDEDEPVDIAMVGMVCLHSDNDALPPGSRGLARSLAMRDSTAHLPKRRSFTYEPGGPVWLDGQELEVVMTDGDNVLVRLPTTKPKSTLPGTFTPDQQRQWEALQNHLNGVGRQINRDLGLDRRAYILNFQRRTGMLVTVTPGDLIEPQPIPCR